MNLSADFTRRIRPSVQAEFDAARWHELRGTADLAIHHLQRAHILGQASPVPADLRQLIDAARRPGA